MGKPVCIIAGVGNATGTGAASAREFARDHRVAVLGRRVDDALVRDIESRGGVAIAIPLRAYDHAELARAFDEVARRWPDGELAVAIWNASFWHRAPFLETTEDAIKTSVQVNVVAAFAFAQHAIRAFLRRATPGGTLLVTGATSATRGARDFAAFAAGKHGARALVQSAAREFGPQGVHCAFVIVDGTIATDATRRQFGRRGDRDEGWLDDRTQSLSPDSIARAYRFLAEQPADCWTHELDLRPAKEHF